MYLSGPYNVDIVFCVDLSKSMEALVSNFKQKAADFYESFISNMNEEDKGVAVFRVKIITFNGGNNALNTTKESKFFVFPDEEKEFVSYVMSLDANGPVTESRNALEAVALAFKSNWNKNSDNLARQAIVVLTDSKADSFEEHVTNKSYPQDMPKDLAELGNWWDDMSLKHTGFLSTKFTRLLVFAPEAYPWKDIQTWNRYWLFSLKEGHAVFDDYDVDKIIASTVFAF